MSSYIPHPELCGKLILFTNNIMMHRRYYALAKIYELMNAHIISGASDTFINNFLIIRENIYSTLQKIDKGEEIDISIIETFINDMMSIVNNNEVLDDNLKLAIRVDTENYNPYKNTYRLKLK